MPRDSRVAALARRSGADRTKNEKKRHAGQKGFDMQDLAELERRIAAALQRIGDGIEAVTAAPPPAEDAAAKDDIIADLTAALEAERQANADLRAQLEEAQSAAPMAVDVPADAADLQARLDRMTAQLDVQGLEMQRMRKTVVQLRENLRGLRRSQAANLADPDQINRAMMAELEAMRVTRLSEVAEMDEILSELTPLITEERADA
ncbi:hypothetical protein [Tabrizicola sp. M-4]|uniref:hypothetical protein n=1 Tax=Tabrizicola sp. M-4 TaxID=3055847 RepID=UPI003DA9E1C2